MQVCGRACACLCMFMCVFAWMYACACVYVCIFKPILLRRRSPTAGASRRRWKVEPPVRDCVGRHVTYSFRTPSRSSSPSLSEPCRGFLLPSSCSGWSYPGIRYRCINLHAKSSNAKVVISRHVYFITSYRKHAVDCRRIVEAHLHITFDHHTR